MMYCQTPHVYGPSNCLPQPERGTMQPVSEEHLYPGESATRAQLAQLILSVKSIRELGMRQVALAEKLTQNPPSTTVQTVQALIAKGGRGNLDVSMALTALVGVLEHPTLLSYDLRSEFYAAANQLQAPEVSYILLEGQPDQAEEVEDMPRPIIPSGKPLTLGERKSAARTTDRRILSNLIHDPNMQVVDILLGNPHLVETDLLVMAAKRPADRRTLQRIAHHPRWSQGRRIRLALALNPDCPLPLACRLCLDLRDSDLKEIARNSASPPLLRGHATRLLSRRI